MTLKEKPSGFPRHRWGRAPHETDAARLATLGVAWLATCAARRVVEHDAGRRRARRVCIPSTRAIALKPINLGPATDLNLTDRPIEGEVAAALKVYSPSDIEEANASESCESDDDSDDDDDVADNEGRCDTGGSEGGPDGKSQADCAASAQDGGSL